MTDSLTVRRLGPADLSRMRALNQLFGAAFDDPDTYGARPPDDAWLRRLLALPHVFALAAWINGELAGGLVAYDLPKLEQKRSEIYIYDLAVAEPMRRRGVAKALIGHLQAMAADLGAWVIFVQADHGDDPAIALYESLGVREDVLHFDIPIRPTRV